MIFLHSCSLSMVYQKKPYFSMTCKYCYWNSLSKSGSICFLSLQNSPNIYMSCEVTILCCVIHLQALILLLAPTEASEVLCKPPSGFMCIMDTGQLMKLVGKICWKMKATKLSTPLQSNLLWLFPGCISGTISLWPFFLFNFDLTKPLFYL